MFNRGLLCEVTIAENLPTYLEADMSLADGNDLRLEHIRLPPGVTPVRTPQTRENGGNFLIARAKRIRG